MKETSSDLKFSQSSLNNWIQSAKSNEGIVEHRGSENYSSDSEKETSRLKKSLEIKKMH